ncbi:MAG: phosphohydrolase [Betaproteobacteria bacterium RIFCSPLOWO2_02_FULL_62_17]|nr:MAG: phosphohydrolase [Betaproteobacteria bacterium RIFCSPLOWO2_02_FULL_62_17]
MAEHEPDSGLYDHADPLDVLNRSVPLDEKLASIHEALYAQIGFVDRISVAAYDPASDLLKTFLASSPGRNHLVRYEARLADSPSLAEVLRAGRPRMVTDLELFRQGRHLHTRVIAEEGYRWSYTVPMYLDGSFWGFIFFNSRTPGALAEPALRMLDVHAHLISAIVTAEMLAVRILAAAVRTAHDMVHFRDPETGGHIDRMSRYARLIAQHLAATGAAELDDAAIEHIFEFAPLHDIGKLALPDRILLKPSGLSDAEREEMKQHTVRGLEIIEAIAHNFGLEHLDGLDLLRHIAESHHETMDGGGYPHGLHDGEIPLEARIVAVADVFDALTSTRPYKPSWSNDEAFAWLRKLSRSKFDQNCVDALLYNAKKVKEIQAQFRDPVAGPSSGTVG